MKKIIIIGAGGNSKIIIDIIKARKKMLNENIEILGILDDDENKKELMGYPVLGKIKEIYNYFRERDISCINGIGDNIIRKKIITEVRNQKIETYQNDNTQHQIPDTRHPRPEFYTAIHPTAIIGSNVTIGIGTVIMPNVIINADTTIGEHSILNTGSIVEHDNIVGNYTHLASSATTAGNVKIGEATLVGTGTKIIQGVKVGNNSIIGAGSVVIKDIPDNSTAVGVPARVIKVEGLRSKE